MSDSRCSPHVAVSLIVSARQKVLSSTQEENFLTSKTFAWHKQQRKLKVPVRLYFCHEDEKWWLVGWLAGMLAAAAKS